MQQHQNGDTYGKFGMPGFMPEQHHAKPRAQAAADDSQTHQGGFRDTPCVFLCFALIRKHKRKGKRIDY